MSEQLQGRDQAAVRAFISERVSVIPITGCWMWMARLARRNYGRADWKRRAECAHRLSYEAFVGPIPDGLTLDHQCDHPWCVAPHHLKPKTIRDNVLRSQIGLSATNARKIACKRGHPFTPENTYLEPRGNTGRVIRVCRACWKHHHDNWVRRRAAKRKEGVK